MEVELTPEPTPVPEHASAPAAAAPVASPVPSVPPHPDRTTGLVIFGVIQIVLGLMAALMVPLIALGAAFSRLAPGGSMRPAQYVSAVATYGFLAAAFVVLGIGSVRTKRWARSLTLVFSWYGLIVGVLITVLLTAVLPVSTRTALQIQQNAPGAPSAAVSAGVMAVILTIIIVFCAIFLIALPIAFVIFYSRADVAATCCDRDPVEPWTDRTPLPVLGASTVFFVGALYLLLTGISTPIFPFFGRYLTGIAASACFLILAVVDVCIAVAVFRLKVVGWWIAVLTLPVRLLSMALTYPRADLLQAYSRMGWSDAQLQMLQANPIFRGHVILWWSLLSLLIFLGYLLWLKRYFKAPPASLGTETLPAQPG